MIENIMTVMDIFNEIHERISKLDDATLFAFIGLVLDNYAMDNNLSEEDIEQMTRLFIVMQAEAHKELPFNQV